MEGSGRSPLVKSTGDLLASVSCNKFALTRVPFFGLPRLGFVCLLGQRWPSTVCAAGCNAMPIAVARCWSSSIFRTLSTPSAGKLSFKPLMTTSPACRAGPAGAMVMPAASALAKRASPWLAVCSRATHWDLCCFLQQSNRWRKKPVGKLIWPSSGFLAGDIGAVSSALSVLHQRAGTLGLQLNFDKCELVAVGQTFPIATHGHFPRSLLFDSAGGDRVARNFTLLGAPIGDEMFCAAHTAARAKLAGPLLDQISELDDPGSACSGQLLPTAKWCIASAAPRPVPCTSQPCKTSIAKCVGVSQRSLVSTLTWPCLGRPSSAIYSKG